MVTNMGDNEPIFICCNGECNWTGPLSDTVHPKHDPNHLLCPECYEVVEELDATEAQP
jgi:hypothetical protein